MTILASLARAYERLADRKEVPPFGYSRTTISYCIVLRSDGRPAFHPVDLRARSGKKIMGRRISVPTPLVQRTSGIASNFLWDKTAYSLGVTAAAGKRLAAEHAEFKRFNLEALAGTKDVGLLCFERFLNWWDPRYFDELAWSEEIRDESIVFALEASYRDHFLHEREAAQLIWSDLLTAERASELTCLVTGVKGRVARSHLPVKGVWDAQSSGAYIVSYNANAFESYGNKEGDNAPVSESAAFAYTTALNRFLERDSPNRIQIGDASTVFWADATLADAKAAETAAAAVEEIFRDLLAEGASEKQARRIAEAERPGLARTDETTEAVKVGDALRQIRAGRPGEIHLGIAEHVRFHVLGLAPNAARLSVRFWLDDEFGVLARRYAEHVHRMRIEPPGRDENPSIWRCLIETATLRKTENIPPNLGGDWLRAILAGSPYPLTLLTTLLMRMRADKDVNALRAAMLKAVLMKNFGYTEKEAPVALDPDNKEPGYLLGRLFAIYERIQIDALPGLNATIRDKFYGAASATPRKVFTLLDRGSANHLAKIAKDSKGRAVNLEKVLASIMAQLSPDGDPFPAFLSTEQQALFPLGYYHQKSEFFRRRDAGVPTSSTEVATA